MAELKALGYFFRTLDTELDRIIEAEDLLTRASDRSIPSHEELSAAEDVSEEFPEVKLWDDLYEDQYWEELSAKFRPHFYAAVTLLIVAVLEAGLTRLSRFLQAKNKLPISLDQLRGSTLEQFKLFAKLNKWPMPSDDSWEWAADLYRVRNALVHEAGSVYTLAEHGLETRVRQFREIASRRPGLQVEEVHETASLLEEPFGAGEGRPRKKSKQKPPRLEAVTLTIQREFCTMALEQVQSVLDTLHAPLMIRWDQKSRSRSRRRPRK